MLASLDVASTIPNHPAARGSLLELREEPRNLQTRALGLDLWQALDTKLPKLSVERRGVGATEKSATLEKAGSERNPAERRRAAIEAIVSRASLWPVVREENSSRQKLANSQGRPGGDRRADCRSFEQRRFARRDRGARGLDGKTGVAGKWRRNGLKRLNPGPEMVWPRKPRTHNIWYGG